MLYTLESVDTYDSEISTARTASSSEDGGLHEQSNEDSYMLNLRYPSTGEMYCVVQRTPMPGTGGGSTALRPAPLVVDNVILSLHYAEVEGRKGADAAMLRHDNMIWEAGKRFFFKNKIL